jgi:hypothetical protein
MEESNVQVSLLLLSILLCCLRTYPFLQGFLIYWLNPASNKFQIFGVLIFLRICFKLFWIIHLSHK